MQWMSVLQLGWLRETKMLYRCILYRWKKKINQILKVHGKREALRLAQGIIVGVNSAQGEWEKQGGWENSSAQQENERLMCRC